jgi:hypothetical protein
MLCCIREHTQQDECEGPAGASQQLQIVWATWQHVVCLKSLSVQADKHGMLLRWWCESILHVVQHPAATGWHATGALAVLVTAAATQKLRCPKEDNAPSHKLHV